VAGFRFSATNREDVIRAARAERVTRLDLLNFNPETANSFVLK
jgi:hypothetical protein